LLGGSGDAWRRLDSLNQKANYFPFDYTTTDYTNTRITYQRLHS
jgi:hypothetical protein